MKALFICWFFLLLFSLFHKTYQADKNQKLYVKSVFCKSNEKFIYKNHTCFAKSYSRTVSTLTVIFVYKKPISGSMLRVRLLYKYGQIFRDVFIPVVIDWCEMMESRNRNKIVKELLHFMELSSPGMVHDCPFYGTYVQNSTLRGDGLMSIWPSGEYRMEFYAYFKSGEYILDANVTAIFSTPLKTNF